MSKNRKNKLMITLGVFVISMITYLLTVAPTVSFWDCGEFIACANILGVPHPPGTPFFMFLGRAFIVVLGALTGDAMNIGYRVNLISVLGSALGVAFTFLFAEKLLALIYKVKKMDWVTVSGGLVAAFLVNFSDTYWFNAVEAEVYGLAMFIVIAISWLSLKWVESRETEWGGKYLILICYLAFLGVGFHLYTVMTLPAVFVMMLMISPAMRSNIVLMITGTVLVGAIIMAIGNFVLISLILLVALIGLYLTLTEQSMRKNISLSIVCVVVALLGFSTYAYIPIRSALNPRIDENNPEVHSVFDYKSWETFRAFVERKQYGSEGMLKRALHRRGALSNQMLSHPHMGYGGYMLAQYLPWKVGFGNSRYKDNTKRVEETFSLRENEHLSAFGTEFRTQMEIMPPHSSKGRHFIWFLLAHIILFSICYSIYKKNKALGVYIFMLYGMTSFGLIFYMNFSDGLRSDLAPYLQWVKAGADPSRLPGLVHMEVRERDYFYTPAYIFMSVLLGLGAGLLIAKFKDAVSKLGNKSDGVSSVGKLIAVSLIVVSFIVPAVSNYHIHDRSKVYVPFDYAKNLLESCRPNSILFTNGDNDTFPLWYMQEVENVRKDVRVINLSLGNTIWYVQQLVDQEPKVKLGFPEGIQNLAPKGNSFTKTTRINVTGTKFNLDMPGRDVVPYYKIQDRLVMSLVINNFPERPIHFASTVGPNNMMNFQNYMVLEGMVYTLTEDPNSRRKLNPVRTAYLVDSVYKYRGLGDKDVYLNGDTKQMLTNYVQTTHQLSLWYADKVAQAKGELKALQGGTAPVDSTLTNPAERITALEAEIAKYTKLGTGYIEELSKNVPWEGIHYYYSGQFYLTIEDYAKAEEILLKGVAVGKRVNIINNALTQVYLKQEAFDKLEKYFEGINPNPQAFNQYLGALENKGRFAQGKSAIEVWLQKNPEDPNVRYFQSKLSNFVTKMQSQIKPKTLEKDSNASKSKTDSTKAG